MWGPRPSQEGAVHGASPLSVGGYVWGPHPFKEEDVGGHDPLSRRLPVETSPSEEEAVYGDFSPLRRLLEVRHLSTSCLSAACTIFEENEDERMSVIWLKKPA